MKVWPLRKSISGIVHNSGGGMTKCLNYLARPMTVVKDDLIQTPTLFEMIQGEANVDWKEMYQVFNMGVGMEIYVKGYEAAEGIVDTASKFVI
jgi:phosphoribosylformylglycinamidine cyclo-ligase